MRHQRCVVPAQPEPVFGVLSRHILQRALRILGALQHGEPVHVIVDALAVLRHSPDVRQVILVIPLDVGSENPHADDRVKILLDVRSRSRALEDNYRYWLLLYRAVCESFSAKSGPLSLDVLRKEGDTARNSLLRLEPEYGRFLTKQAGWEKPGHLPTAWPRSVNALWKYENSFVS